MANGMLSSLPPGLLGYVAGEQGQRERGMGELQQLGGVLSIKNALAEQEMTPLKLEQLKIALANAKMNNDLRRGLLVPEAGGMGGGGGGGSLAFGPGGISTPGGGQANLQTGQTAAAPQLSQGGGGQFGISPQIMNMLLSGDTGLMATGKAILEQQKPIVGREGAPILGRRADGSLGVDFYAPKTAPGMMLDFGPNATVTGANPIRNYAQGVASIEGATTGAAEDARAARDIVQIPGQPVQTRAQVINRIGGGAPRQTMPGVAPAPVPAPTPIPQPAPAGAPNPMVVPTAAETAAQVETGKGRAKSGVDYENSVLESGRTARNNMTQLQILAPMIEKLPTGPIYNTMLNGAALFKQFGMDVGKMGEQLGPAQASTAILNRMALAVRNPSGGEGMPGALSDADRDFLLRTIPNLSNMPEGNKTLIKIMTALEQRKVDESQIVSKMQADKKSSNEIRDALNQYANSRKMFE